MIQILIADDDAHIRELLQHTLRTEGYVVFEAADGEEASLLLTKTQIHLAVVDVMMPNKDGYQLCEEIRNYYDFPIILLTAKDQLLDKEKGFSVGTDDYLTKPFEPKELLFRIKALLRRYQMVNVEKIRLNETIIDRKSYEVQSQGKVFMLPMKEFELLSQLASYPERIFTREELIHLIWGSDFTGDDRTIDVHIKRLRERFSDRADDFIIKTIRGVGYKLEVTKK
ncbi:MULTISPECIES: response regulator transcription factor [Metabacillus]|jgi:two-component system, OmpR family, response regulator|uniref:Heme response regulator HssR n=1 Tax=Metabacillus rhizolycopersici TaxID=2875709 RepID=A0ABS7UNK0_9BACI|nr:MULTISPECIES: response regulator transcription factor [Metabacillus]MBZ5749515.1 response regulator transcription factor [Metabacillus rhizolycopersici]MCM3653290.1 response regulator transcription factor [Metabacillus litoralis]